MGKKNLLFIFTDEQRFDTLACYGNDQIDMPNLNKLASMSTVFDQAYVTQPVCTPSRASLLTGLYPHTHGCTENNWALKETDKCFPELLEKGKYSTAYYGKWHLGDEIFAQHGFDDWRSTEDMYRNHFSSSRDKNARSTYHHYLLEKGFEPMKEHNVFGRGMVAKFPEEYSKPAYLAGEASKFIREHKNNPFVLFVNFLEPHMPFTGPRDKQYDPNKIPLPENFDAIPTTDQPLKTRLLYQYYKKTNSEGPSQTQKDWRELRARYWGLCSQVDTHAGRILNTLEECGLLDDTIIVFTSDHGDMMGSHQLLAKCVMFQEAIRIPLLIHLPGQKSTKTIKGPVSQIDLVPTLLDLMDQPIPSHLQGKSLFGPQPSNPVIVEWNQSNGVKENLLHTPFQEPLATPEQIEAAAMDPVRTVITSDGWKFNYSPLGEHELYNLNKDPYETMNIADHAKRKEMADHLRRWSERTNDKVEIK